MRFRLIFNSAKYQAIGSTREIATRGRRGTKIQCVSVVYVSIGVESCPRIGVQN